MSVSRWEKTAPWDETRQGCIPLGLDFLVMSNNRISCCLNGRPDFHKISDYFSLSASTQVSQGIGGLQTSQMEI